MIHLTVWLVAKLLNSHHVPFPVVPMYVFLLITIITVSSSFDGTSLPFTVYTGIRAGKTILTSPVEKILLFTIKKCLNF